MTRLHDMFYGPPPKRSKRTEQHDSSVQEVSMDQDAIDALMAQLRCTGRWRSGVLFGTLQDGTLNICYAAPGTTPGRQVGDGLPLALDDDYLLGWADALTGTHQSELDWQGVWLTTPNSELPDELEQWRWVQQAREWGLLTEELILLFVGWRDGRLTGQAYVQQDEPTSIIVRFKNGPLAGSQ